MIEISISGVSIKVPAWIVPGQNQKTITLELGYGREFSGRIGSGVGFNVYPLRTSSNMGYAMNAEIKTLNETYPLASTQEHYGLEEDKLAAPGFSDLSTNEVQSRIPDLVKQSTLEEYKKHPEFVQDIVESHKPDKKRSWCEV